MRKTLKLQLILLTVLLSLSLLGAGLAWAEPKQGGELVVGLAWEPSKIDPHRTAAENGVLAVMQVCETLVNKIPGGDFVPGLATKWEISEDGKAYTFHLRKGIKFHDGTPFNAEAVKANFERIVAPETKSEQAVDYIGPYESTEVVDEHTVVLHLKSPFAALLSGLSSGHLAMVSPTAAAKWGPDEFQDHLIGTGPFIFKEWKRKEHIRLERNPDYWGGPELFAHHGPAYLDAVVFKFVQEAGVRSGTIETNEIQVAQDIPSVDVPKLKDNPNVEVLIQPASGTGVVCLFNMSKEPTSDLKVRQALNYAIDQKAIATILYKGLQSPNYGPLTPNTTCYWAGAEKMYPFDQEKAKALLKEAGWTDTNGDGVVDKDGKPMVLQFPTHGGFPLYRDPVPIIKAQLAEVGVDVNIMNNAVPAWLEAGRTGNQHIGIVDWRDPDPDFDLRSMFHSSNKGAFAWNWHQNAKLDDLLIQGMVTSDQAKRCQIYEEIQKIIMDDAMIKPINMLSAIVGVRKEVKGWMFGLRPSFFFLFDVYLEK